MSDSPTIVGKTVARNVVTPPDEFKYGTQASIEAAKARDAELPRRSGPVLFRCALCPEWESNDLREQTRHIRDVHGIEDRPRFKGMARGPKRSPNKNAKARKVAPDGSCLTCGQTHKTGRGFSDHDAWLRMTKAAAEASRRKWANARPEERREHGRKIRRAISQPAVAGA